MVTLKTSLGTIYFYIKDSIIFNISSNNNGDVCAKKGVSGNPQSNEAKVPFIQVKPTDSSAVTNFFLTDLISDGDAYSSDTFYHHCDEGTAKTIPQYYEQLCKEQIVKSIINNPTKEFDYWVEHKQYLGIPMWMIQGEGYTVTGITQITFNESYFNTVKNEVVQEQAYNAAQNMANRFGYKVTSAQSALKVTKI
jgi:hypothetical protein